MIRIIIFQAVVLFIATIVVGIAFDGVSSGFLFFAGLSILLPNLFLALNLYFVKFKWVSIWITIIINKILVLVLLIISIKFLEKPDFFALLIGIIIVTQTPLVYALLAFKRKEIK